MEQEILKHELIVRNFLYPDHELDEMQKLGSDFFKSCLVIMTQQLIMHRLGIHITCSAKISRFFFKLFHLQIILSLELVPRCKHFFISDRNVEQAFICTKINLSYKQFSYEDAVTLLRLIIQNIGPMILFRCSERVSSSSLPLI